MPWFFFLLWQTLHGISVDVHLYLQLCDCVDITCVGFLGRVSQGRAADVKRGNYVIWVKRCLKKRDTCRWCNSHHALRADMHRLVMLIFKVLCRTCTNVPQSIICFVTEVWSSLNHNFVFPPKTVHSSALWWILSLIRWGVTPQDTLQSIKDIAASVVCIVTLVGDVASYILKALLNPCFSHGLQTTSVAACIYTCPIDTMMTEFPGQHMTTQVIQKLLPTIFWSKWQVFLADLSDVSWATTSTC